MRWLIFLSLLVGAVAGYFFWFAERAAAPLPPPPPPPVALSVGSLRFPLAGWRLATTTESSEVSLTLEDPGARRAEVVSFVERTLAGYVEMIDPAAMPADELAWIRESGRRYDFSAAGAASLGQGGRSSYRLALAYDTGGAHPNGVTVTESYGPDGAKLSLADIIGGDQTLERLTAAVRPRLLAQINERVAAQEGAQAYRPGEDFAAGTAPSPENYAAWYLSGDSLVVAFNPYQVGPYTLGTYEVAVPISEIR